jgi:protein-disulfide isomerase/uncharacterized membrane protein
MSSSSSVASLPYSSRLYYAALILITIGLSLSIYLFSVHIGARLGATPGGLCSFFGGGCGEALRSPLSKLFGAPLAAWGIVFYVILIVQLGMHRLASGASHQRASGVTVLLTGTGASAGILLLSVMTFGETAFCPLCALLHIVNMVLFVLILNLTGRPVISLIRGAWDAIRHFALAGSPLTQVQRLSFTGTVAALLVGLALYLWAVIIEKDFDRRAEAVDEQALVADFNQLPARVITIHPDDAVLGDTSALVKVVLFSDFACPGCAVLARELMKLTPLFGDDAVLVFKHLPLDSECNPMLKNPLHPHSCEAARAAEAARLQGRFWEYHDALFLSGIPETSAGFAQLAVETGCDSLQFIMDLSGAAARSALERGVKLAQELRLEGTPALFINGRQIRDLRPRAVHALLERIMLDVRRFKAAFAPTPANALSDTAAARR